MDVLFTQLKAQSSQVLNSLDPGFRQDDGLCLNGVLPDGY